MDRSQVRFQSGAKPVSGRGFGGASEARPAELGRLRFRLGVNRNVSR